MSYTVTSYHLAIQIQMFSRTLVSAIFLHTRVLNICCPLEAADSQSDGFMTDGENKRSDATHVLIMQTMFK